MNILVQKYNPFDGHLGAINYKANAYIEDGDEFPGRGEPIPLPLHGCFSDGRSCDVLYRDEVNAAIAELRSRASRHLSVRTANVKIIDRPS